MIGLGTYAYFWQHAEGLSLIGAFEDTNAGTYRELIVSQC